MRVRWFSIMFRAGPPDFTGCKPGKPTGLYPPLSFSANMRLKFLLFLVCFGLALLPLGAGATAPFSKWFDVNGTREEPTGIFTMANGYLITAQTYIPGRYYSVGALYFVDFNGNLLWWRHFASDTAQVEVTATLFNPKNLRFGHEVVVPISYTNYSYSPSRAKTYLMRVNTNGDSLGAVPISPFYCRAANFFFDGQEYSMALITAVPPTPFEGLYIRKFQWTRFTPNLEVVLDTTYSLFDQNIDEAGFCVFRRDTDWAVCAQWRNLSLSSPYNGLRVRTYGLQANGARTQISEFGLYPIPANCQYTDGVMRNTGEVVLIGSESVAPDESSRIRVLNPMLQPGPAINPYTTPLYLDYFEMYQVFETESYFLSFGVSEYQGTWWPGCLRFDKNLNRVGRMNYILPKWGGGFFPWTRAPDGGFTGAGYFRHTPNFNSEDLWVLHVDSNGCANPECLPLGMDSPDASGEFSLYPNPNTGSFVLRLSQPGTARVEVCNLLGEVVFATQAMGAKETTLSTGLAQGVYVCRVIQEGRVAYQTKLMIQ